MKNKAKLSVLLLLLLVIVVSGCGGSKYSMIGSWSGVFQDGDSCTITFTSETSGTLIFSNSQNSYYLIATKTGEKTFQATYGWQSDDGWENRVIIGEFVSTSSFVARIYYGNYEISAGIFTKK
ncbi:MAG: hypothetical protein KAX49_18400 [Halanaerobiales bacterium]|nr:hypothetical protein [Halanaerobiales bacterium]